VFYFHLYLKNIYCKIYVYKEAYIFSCLCQAVFSEVCTQKCKGLSIVQALYRLLYEGESVNSYVRTVLEADIRPETQIKHMLDGLLPFDHWSVTISRFVR
jgi:hypothetical protein